MASPHWLFGPFRLDPDNACLWHGAQARRLTPKAFSLLHYLVTHADRLITKGELFAALWPDTTVSEATLRVCIGELRHALGEAARAPQFIATVARRGYRFLAPVTRQDPSAMAGPDAMAQGHHALVTSAGPLVGRKAVLDRLHAIWGQARQGARQVCLVTGEAGIGKTTVVETFAAQVTTEPTVWLAHGQCVEPYGTREAYRPVLEDWLFHSFFPLLGYAMLLISGYVAMHNTRRALFLIGAATLLFLFVGIHNAWDSVTYVVFVQSHKDGAS